MKRIHLFEFEDFNWFPHSLRQMMTLYLVTFHRLLGTSGMFAPLIARACQMGRTQNIVDLCSGGSGPMMDIAKRLRTEHGLARLRVTLTDLYPNRTAADRINAMSGTGVVYETQPVDAGNVAREMNGVRTMICSMHHMRPEVAKRILQDAFEKRQPMVVLEISDNSPPIFLWWLAIPFGVIATLLLTPFVRPLSFGQLFFTYVIPVLPLLIAWDGAVSNARTYTANDLAALTADLQSPDYHWEIGGLKKKGYPGAMPYLLGLPKAA